MPKPDLNEQIQCVRREIKMRERVYPRWIEKGNLMPAKAESEIAAMKAVEETLLDLLNNQEFKLE